MVGNFLGHRVLWLVPKDTAYWQRHCVRTTCPKLLHEIKNSHESNLCIAKPVALTLPHILNMPLWTYSTHLLNVVVLWCRVCRRWNRITTDKFLWQHIDLSPYNIKKRTSLKMFARRHFTNALLSLRMKGSVSLSMSVSTMETLRKRN